MSCKTTGSLHLLGVVLLSVICCLSLSHRAFAIVHDVTAYGATPNDDSNDDRRRECIAPMPNIGLPYLRDSEMIMDSQ